jgi:hypothetical protein
MTIGQRVRKGEIDAEDHADCGRAGTMAQQTPKQGAAGEMKVTGVVTKADEQTGEITIGDKTLVMEPGEGMYPRVGSKVTALYEDRNGKNVITRIGQAQQ